MPEKEKSFLWHPLLCGIGILRYVTKTAHEQNSYAAKHFQFISIYGNVQRKPCMSVPLKHSIKISNRLLHFLSRGFLVLTIRRRLGHLPLLPVECSFWHRYNNATPLIIAAFRLEILRISVKLIHISLGIRNGSQQTKT